MKSNLLVALLSLIAHFSFSSCDDASVTVYLGNKSTGNIKSAVQQMITNQGCGLDFNSDFEYQTGSLSVNSHTVLNYAQLSQFISNNGETIDIESMTEFIYANNDPAIFGYTNYYMSISEFMGIQNEWTLNITTYLDNFWTLNPKGYNVKFKIKNPGNVDVIPYLCSAKGYRFEDLVTYEPSNYSSSYLEFTNGETFNNDTVYFNQTTNNKYDLIYHCNIGGHPCKRMFINKNLNELESAYFTSVIQDAGVITSNSSSELMSNYITISGGDLNCYGSGLVNNGGVYYFDPSIANPGDNVVYVRAANNGCYSEWHDTVFYVTPIVSNLPTPQFNYQSTFGPGENGLIFGQNTNGTYSSVGRFHFGCSNTDYTFTTNNIQPGVFFEWQVVYQNYIYATGTGNSFTVSTPDRVDVGTNLSSSLYSVQSMYSNTSLTNNGILFFGYDYDQSGGIDSDEAFYSSYMGDQMRVMVRSYNAAGDTSNWSIGVVGLVKSPELIDNSKLCYSGNPSLGAITTTEVYLDSMNYNEYRSSIWDVNNDGVFEYDGSVDSVLHLMTNTNKMNLFQTQIIDSVKIRAWEPVSGQSYNIYHPSASEVCSSVVDTVFVVREPGPVVTFSDVGVLEYGTPVLGVVTGDYFDVGSDSIIWNWSDGSPLYYGDSAWHYYNDLGSYSLVVTVVDNYGCSVDSVFLNHWFVPGYLNTEELENSSVSIYPNPTVEVLNIDTELIIERVEIYSLTGSKIMEENTSIVDVSMLSNGVYYLNVISEHGNKFTLKFVKQ